MYRRWGFAEDQVVTCYDILEATLRRAHLTPYDPEEAAGRHRLRPLLRPLRRSFLRGRL